MSNVCHDIERSQRSGMQIKQTLLILFSQIYTVYKRMVNKSVSKKRRSNTRKMWIFAPHLR